MSPKWSGFNFPHACFAGRTSEPTEDEFRWVAEWGFNFVRLPLTYTNWIRNNDPMDIDESWFGYVDRCLQICERHGIHLNVCMHRAPGYSTSRQRVEPFDLWSEREAQDAFCYHWETIARRYRGVVSAQLSFNLVNEPSRVDAATYVSVARRAIDAIAAVDKGRLIVADGIQWGNVAVPELVSQRVVQSCRAYYPLGVSHYRAEWEDHGDWPEPSWPGVYHGSRWDRERLERLYAPWIALADKGAGVHCGEGGAYNHTPHAVVIGWLRDVLAVLKPHGIGFALWNFRGPFGVLNSRRSDVAYEEWHGLQLDRELLRILQEAAL
jgi:endoglucanase